MKQVFVIIPSAIPDGPMKGAVALCNGMVSHCMVHMVSINKGNRSIDSELKDEVKRVKLEECNNWIEKVRTFRTKVKEAGNSGPVTHISFSLKADILSLAVREKVKRISRVSSNLLKNYQYDYGLKGVIAAIVHFQIMRLFDIVISMSNSMTKQLKRYGVKRVENIGNFIDEKSFERKLEKVKNRDKVNFIFLGSLTKRKRPELAIRAVIESNKKGANCKLDMVGEGPLRDELENLIDKYKANSFIKLHGYVEDPFSILINCDYMVLPSESEGVSRAVIESLFFGLPCISRDVDGNSEIIKQGENGILFHNDKEFMELISQIAINGIEKREEVKCLLPDEFRQSYCVSKYMELLA